MSARELQQACRDRGLPTARDKDTMVSRLEEADAAQGLSLAEGEYVMSGTAVRKAAEEQTLSPSAAEPNEVADLASLVPVTPAVHREEFPARDGGPDDDEHTACRAATLAAAQAHGYTPMGDAHRAATADGMWVYEVHLRRGLA